MVGGEKTEDTSVVPRSVAVLDRVRHKKTTINDLTLAEQQKSHGHRVSVYSCKHLYCTCFVTCEVRT